MSVEIKAIREHILNHGSVPTSFGELRVEKSLLGQGGNGLVYPVEFEGPAVIKFLAESIGEKPSSKYQRFQREYQRLVRIPNHPNLVRLFHYDVVNISDMKFPAIIMERCARSLKSHVQQMDKKRLTLADLDDLCEQMCSAIDHIRKHGVIHRDIKPENILVRDDGSFVLADFGIARFDPELFPGTDLTKKGDRMANFAFSAPEQFEKDAEITPAADVYALGQVLYWCGTQTTFRGDSPPTLASVDEQLKPFDGLVKAMSHQQPDLRIQTGSEVIATLKDEAKERRKRKWEQHVVDSLLAFEECLRKCTPGARGVIHFSKRKDIDHLFEELALICKPNELWWTKGSPNSAIDQIEKIDDEHWLLGVTECKITDCWITRDPGADRCSILVRTDPMPTFGLDGACGSGYEVAGRFEGRYIPYEQAEDGFAYIDDEIISLEGRSVHRKRYMRPDFFFIATKYNSVLVEEADKVIGELIDGYVAGKEVDFGELDALLRLPRNRVSAMFD